MSAAPSTTVDPRCVAAAEALAGGDESAMRRHAGACEACAFLSPLVDMSTVGTAGLGAALETALDRAIATGEPFLGRYRVTRILARGGQGVVCRADAEELGPVAIKVLRCNRAAPRAAEGRAQRVRHLGVCRTFHVERHGDLRVVVMEFVDGPDLEEARGSLSVAERVRVFREVCTAVAAIHRAGLLHLDLKPRNILLPPGGEPIVADFGLAAEIEEDGRATPLGYTAAFAPPEQRRLDRVGPRADVYALGKLLLHLVPDPPRHLLRLASRATSEREEDRQPSAEALLAEIEEPERRRRRLAAAGAGIAGLAIVFAGAWLAFRPARSHSLPAPDVILDFDSVETYARITEPADAAEHLRGYGITVSEVTAGSRLVVLNHLGSYEGRALVPTSAPNVLAQIGVLDPVSFTLVFDRPLAAVSFQRPTLVAPTESGITFPEWSAHALDDRGEEVARVGEAQLRSHVRVDAKRFELTPPSGKAIHSVRFRADSAHFTAFAGLVLDDLGLTHSARQ